MTASPYLIQYWNTEEIPFYIGRLFDTFRNHNPDFQHRVFNQSTAEEFIGDRFGQRELAAFRACAIPAMQADYLRYCAVLALGGVWADADYRCARPLRPLVDRLDTGEIFLSPTPLQIKGQDATRVWNGFFTFRQPGHPLLALTLEIATASIEARTAEQVWAVGQNVAEAIALTVGIGIFTLMKLMYEWGSFDAVLDGIADTPFAPFGELYCETIEGYDRIVEAFEGVRVSPHKRMLEWVADPDFDLPYKQTEMHWAHAKTGIFR